MAANKLLNYVNGEWRTSSAESYLDVINPATTEVIGQVPLSPAAEIDEAVEAAAAAQREWAHVPAEERIQYLFKLKTLLEENFEDLCQTITMEAGKTLAESRGEMLRAVENVEVACGIPTMMQGNFMENIARGIDETMIRQPVGVCGIIVPFNFPGMISFWFFPYAIACGNTCIIKPSERVPLTTAKYVAHLKPKHLISMHPPWKEPLLSDSV
jgi:malonate-semialdehyde dehydrogenase (acetylating)/methylmalonate-semialdehyde dehydrogenase